MQVTALGSRAPDDWLLKRGPPEASWPPTLISGFTHFTKPRTKLPSGVGLPGKVQDIELSLSQMKNGNFLV